MINLGTFDKINNKIVDVNLLVEVEQELQLINQNHIQNIMYKYNLYAIRKKLPKLKCKEIKILLERNK